MGDTRIVMCGQPATSGWLVSAIAGHASGIRVTAQKDAFDAAFSDYLRSLLGENPIYLLAGEIIEVAQLNVSARSVVIIADEFRAMVT